MYVYDNIEFCIDNWPHIDTLLEIESDSVENVNKGLKLLNLENKDIGNMGVLGIYKKYGSVQQ